MAAHRPHIAVSAVDVVIVVAAVVLHTLVLCEGGDLVIISGVVILQP